MAKALLLMGQANQLTLDQMKSVLGDKGGELTTKDYSRFWTGLSKAETATIFLREMITECIDIEKYIAKKRMEKKGTDVERRLNAIANTINFISSFYDIDRGRANIGKAMRCWDDHRQEMSLLGSPIDDAIRNLKYCHFEEGDVLQSLVLECASCSVREPLHKPTGNIDLDRGCLGDFPFHYTKLHNKLLENEDPKYIYDHIINTLVKIPPQVRHVDPAVMESTVLGLLFLLKEFLTIYPVCDHSYLEEAAYDVISMFMNWPQPSSLSARSVLDLIVYEIQSPGSVLRHRVFHEHPLLGPAGRSVAHKLLEYSVGAANAISEDERNQILRWAASQKTALLYIDPSSVVYAFFSHMLQSQSQPQAMRVNVDDPVGSKNGERVQEQNFVMRRSLLLNMIDCNLDFKDDGREAVRRRVDSAAPGDVLRWYDKAMHISETCLVMGSGSVMSGECQAYRTSQVAQLLHTISPGVGASVKAFVSPDAFHTLSAHELNQALEETSLTFRCENLPRLPDLQFNIQTFSQTPGETAPEALLYIESSQSRQDYETFLTAARAAALPASVKKPMAGTPQAHQGETTGRLGSGGVKPAASTIELFRPIFRVLVMGDDVAFHKVLVNFVAFQHHEPALAASLDIRVYVVPTKGDTNHVARFLAEHDDWYRRQVYAPFASFPLIRPQLKPGATELETMTSQGSGRGMAPMPTSLLPHLLQNYLRGAEEQLPLHVFKCECWKANNGTDAGNDGPADCVIPFAVRLDVGLAASVRGAQLEKPQWSTWQQVVQDKQFSLAAKDGLTPELKIGLLPVGVSGTPQDPIQYRPKQFVSVSFNNVTTDEASGTCSPPCRASPVEPWLNCGALPIKPALSDLLRKSNKKPKDCQIISEYIAQDQEESRVTVATLTATDSSRSFLILADGQLAGPFTQVKVSPVQSPQQRSSVTKFPVQTFFPVHLANPAT